MTKKGRTRKTWYAGLLLLIGMGFIFMSCSDEGSNPVLSNGDTSSDFIASEGQTDEWGAYYYEGDSSFYVNVPEAGDYQLKYAIEGGGPYYITFNTPQRAILEIGLLEGQILKYACVTSGTITVTEETASVGIQTSWKVTVYSITDDDGETVSWWNPGSDAQTIFSADDDGEEICAIEDGALGDGIVEIDPPNKGGSSGSGTTPAAADLTFTTTGGTTLTVTGGGTFINNDSATVLVAQGTATGTYTVAVNNATGTSQNVTITVAGLATQTLNCTGPTNSIMNGGAGLGGNVDSGGASTLTCPTNTTFTATIGETPLGTCTAFSGNYSISPAAAASGPTGGVFTIQNGVNTTLTFTSLASSTGTCTNWYWGAPGAPYYPESYTGTSTGYAIGSASTQPLNITGNVTLNIYAAQN